MFKNPRIENTMKTLLNSSLVGPNPHPSPLWMSDSRSVCTIGQKRQGNQSQERAVENSTAATSCTHSHTKGIDMGTTERNKSPIVII